MCTGACIQPVHPLTQYPFWKPSFFDGSVYPPYDQPLFYPCYPYHQEHACYSPSSNRCHGDAQEPEQNPEMERSFYAPRSSFSAMPFYQPFPMPSNHFPCRHLPPTVQMPVPPCLTVKPYQTMQMKTTHFKQTSIRMSSIRQDQSVNVIPSMHPLHRHMPPFALMGQQPPGAMPPALASTQHFQGPFYPAAHMPGKEMANADRTATKQHPYSAPFNKGDSHEPCHGNPNTG